MATLAQQQAGKRFDGLAEILQTWLAISVRIFERLGEPPALQTIMWVAYLANDEPTQRIAKEAGLDRELLYRQLVTILQADAHLKACCGDVFGLLYYLDRFFVSNLSIQIARGLAGPFDEAYQRFRASTYESGRFTKSVYFHLFNFMGQGEFFDFDDFKIRKFDPISIRSILGLPIFNSLYQKPGLGDYFIEFADAGSEDDPWQWVESRREIAYSALRLLQYCKDGLVHIDYHVPYFTPAWVNAVRRGEGIFYMGAPRRQAYADVAKPYLFSQADFQMLRILWKVFKDTIQPHLSVRSEFRETIMRAGDFFESNFERASAHERLLALSVALEALFCKSENQKRLYMSRRASELVGQSEAERQEICLQLKDLYDRRNDLIHATYDIDKYYARTFVTHQEIDKWCSIVRRAMLRFIVLLCRGYAAESDRTRLLKGLLKQKAEDFRSESDPAEFLSPLVGDVTITV